MVMECFAATKNKPTMLLNIGTYFSTGRSPRSDKMQWSVKQRGPGEGMAFRKYDPPHTSPAHILVLGRFPQLFKYTRLGEGGYK